MKKYIWTQDCMEEEDYGNYYRTSDVDAQAKLEDEVNQKLRERIVELREALREAMGWNWLTDEPPPPAEIVAMCEKALGE